MHDYNYHSYKLVLHTDGVKWWVFAPDGERLGRFDTENAALAWVEHCVRDDEEEIVAEYIKKVSEELTGLPEKATAELMKKVLAVNALNGKTATEYFKKLAKEFDGCTRKALAEEAAEVVKSQLLDEEMLNPPPLTTGASGMAGMVGKTHGGNFVLMGGEIPPADEFLGQYPDSSIIYRVPPDVRILIADAHMALRNHTTTKDNVLSRVDMVIGYKMSVHTDTKKPFEIRHHADWVHGDHHGREQSEYVTATELFDAGFLTFETGNPKWPYMIVAKEVFNPPNVRDGPLSRQTERKQYVRNLLGATLWGQGWGMRPPT